LVLSRSGWDDEAGSLLAFKSGVYGGHGNFERMAQKGAPGGGLNFSHNHADDMSVYLFADGEWQTSNVPGYFIGRDNGAPQANKTRYANSLLVDGAGQVGEGVRAEDYRAAPWFFSRKSSIPLCGSTSNYSFTQGKGEGLYPAAAGLTRFERSVLFAERSFPIVRDVVRSSGSHRFEVTYHAMDAVAQDGQWLKLSGKNDRVLGVRVVSPSSFALATEAQTTTHLQKFDPDGSMTAAFLRPTANTGEVTFLTALVPSRGATWATRPQVAPIDPGVPERGVTVTGFSGAQRLDVVFNDEPGATASAAGVTVTGMAGVKKSDGSRLLRAVLASGQKLVIDGTAWIEVVGAGPATFEVEPVQGGLEVSGDRVPARFYAPGATTVRFNGVSVPFKRVGDFVDVTGESGGEELVDSGCSTFGPTAGGEGPAGGSPETSKPAASPEGGAGCASTNSAPWLLAAFALLPLAVRRRVRAYAAVRAHRPRPVRQLPVVRRLR
ncbi:MAG: heparinase II/III domain-containing protein, partial [Myxococcaceae bacterium]